MENIMSEGTISTDKTELCERCGQALSDFLHQMEEHNAKVVCPSCGKEHDAKGVVTASTKTASRQPRKP